MLGLVVAIPPVWNTFIHSWRVELIASVFLFSSLAYAAFVYRKRLPKIAFSRDEFLILIIPIIAFIVWSSLSMLWANSPISAFHHTLVWIEYLIFYIVVRQVLESGHNYTKLTKMLTATLCFFAILAVFSYCAFILFGGATNVGIVYSKYGEQIVTLLPLFIVGVLRQGRRKFAVGTAAVSLLWLLIFSAQSRTSLILFTAVIVAISAIVFLRKRFRPLRLKMAILLVAFAVAPIPLHLASAFSAHDEAPVLGRFLDEKGLSSSNDFRKLMIRISAGMIASNPVLGLGADNFGFEANKYRAAFAAQDPDNPVLAEAESYIPERAHNEFLQIAAELGIVGVVIFAWFLCGIAVMGFRLLRSVRSPYAIAAMIGVAAFLVSSLVTSYSFRLIQNGFVFFFVLAFGAKLLLKNKKTGSPAPVGVNKMRMRSALAAGCVACVSLAGLSIIRVTSTALTQQANRTASINEAFPVYSRAMTLDITNPEAPYFLGLRLIDAGRYAEAVPYLKESIKIGKARSTDFSFLATAQSLSGDNYGAAQTFAEAASLYPQSVFVLTRYAALLEASGKTEESQQQFERAARIDTRSANTWWALINKGTRAASDLAFKKPDEHEVVMNLLPYDAIFAVIAERDIRFPDERQKFPWERPSKMADQ